MARRLHRRPAGQGAHLDDDGGGRAGAALGRRLQPLFGGGSAAQIDVRARRRLAARMERSRALLLRGRAAPERRRRAQCLRRRQTVRTVPAALNSTLLQPADAQNMGGAERPEIRWPADGSQSDAVRRPRRLLRLRHLRRHLSVGCPLLSRLHIQAARRAEEDRAARSSGAWCSTTPGRRLSPPRDTTRIVPTNRANIEPEHSSSPRDIAGARTCCCSRRTHDSRTASRTARERSGDT